MEIKKERGGDTDGREGLNQFGEEIDELFVVEVGLGDLDNSRNTSVRDKEITAFL